MDEIHDIHGLRLIVEQEEDCYKALGVVHEMWSEVPGKFKDYITHPKFNGYVICQELWCALVHATLLHLTLVYNF